MVHSTPHTTVLLNETVEALHLQEGDIAVDCTVGGGGHAERLAEIVGPSGKVIGLDRDLTALSLAAERLTRKGLRNRVELVHAPFSSLAKVIEERSLVGKIQGITADIGVSSMHLDEANRGFSFQANGPLDMRMDSSQGMTAADLINTASEDDLCHIFRTYGEEPKARLIARRIVEARTDHPFTSTLELANLIKAKIHYPTASRKHPATRVFQALRIAVNDELGQLQKLLEDGLSLLRPGGRLAIISFHSLEDRLVKEAFVEFTGKKRASSIPRDLPISADELARMTDVKAEIIKPFPLIPMDEEISSNPRSRSAKLRVVSKK